MTEMRDKVVAHYRDHLANLMADAGCEPHQIEWMLGPIERTLGYAWGDGRFEVLSEQFEAMRDELTSLVKEGKR